MKGMALAREYGATVVLAAGSGAISFAHIHDLAVRHGQSGWRALVYPVVIDAVTVHSLTILLRKGQRRAVRVLAWAGVVFFTLVSFAANLLDAPAHDPVGMGLSAAPVAAFLFSTLLAHLLTQPADEAAEPVEEVVRDAPEPRRRAPKMPPRTGKAVSAKAVLRELAPEFAAEYQGPARGRAMAFRQMGDKVLADLGIRLPHSETYRSVLRELNA
jgi:hypothetical protein